jgi:hypothetical protein
MSWVATLAIFGPRDCRANPKLIPLADAWLQRDRVCNFRRL